MVVDRRDSVCPHPPQFVPVLGAMVEQNSDPRVRRDVGDPAQGTT
jgi:hypothetical protein